MVKTTRIQRTEQEEVQKVKRRPMAEEQDIIN